MSDTAPKPKAYSYLRFSTAEQAKGDSFRRQTALAEDYARVRGLDLDTHLKFHDPATSAFTGKNRKRGALRAFLDAVEEEIIPAGSFLLVESLDRVSREAILDAQATFLQIVNAGITLVTMKGTPREYSRESVNANPTDLLISLLEMIRAREESETKSQRIKADWTKKRERAAKGEAITSQVPAWLRRSGGALELVPARAEVVRRIYEWRLQGLGQQAITAALNSDGVPTFGGAQWWHRSYVKLVLESPATVGTFVPHRMVAGKREPLEPVLNYFPAVISAETFQAVRALDRPASRAPSAIASFFSGLVRCEQCSGPMIRSRRGTASSGFTHAFVCQGAKMGRTCDFRSVRQDVLEDALTASIGPFVGEAPTHDDALLDELEQLEAALSDTLDQIENITDAVARKPLASLMERLSRLEGDHAAMLARKGEVNAALRDTARPVVIKRLSDLGDALGAPEVDRARVNVLLRQVIDHAVIHFDRSSSPRRPRGQLRFVWKAGGETHLRWGPAFDAVAAGVSRAED